MKYYIIAAKLGDDMCWNVKEWMANKICLFSLPGQAAVDATSEDTIINNDYITSRNALHI